jgi:hypothetical protein
MCKGTSCGTVLDKRLDRFATEPDGRHDAGRDQQRTVLALFVHAGEVLLIGASKSLYIPGSQP